MEPEGSLPRLQEPCYLSLSNVQIIAFNPVYMLEASCLCACFFFFF